MSALLETVSPLPLDLVCLAEYARRKLNENVTEGDSFRELARVMDIDWQRLHYFARTAGAMPKVADLNKILAHLLPEYVVVPLPTAPVFPPDGWRPHPTAPGWFYKGQRVLTEQQLRDEIAMSVAAE